MHIINIAQIAQIKIAHTIKLNCCCLWKTIIRLILRQFLFAQSICSVNNNTSITKLWPKKSYSTPTFHSGDPNFIAKNKLIVSMHCEAASPNCTDDAMPGFCVASIVQSKVTAFSLISMVTLTFVGWRTSVSKVSTEPL